MENLENNIQQEKKREVLISNNLEKMKTEMISLMMSESLGGTGGRMEIDGESFSAMGANGYIDKQTGEIIIFGNTQDVPEELREGKGHFTLQIANNFKYQQGLDQKNFSQARVYSTSDLSDHANEILKETVIRWNALERQKIAE